VFVSENKYDDDDTPMTTVGNGHQRV